MYDRMQKVFEALEAWADWLVSLLGLLILSAFPLWDLFRQPNDKRKASKLPVIAPVVTARALEIGTSVLVSHPEATSYCAGVLSPL